MLQSGIAEIRTRQRGRGRKTGWMDAGGDRKTPGIYGEENKG